jgi:hypothetical protein
MNGIRYFTAIYSAKDTMHNAHTALQMAALRQ